MEPLNSNTVFVAYWIMPCCSVIHWWKLFPQCEEKKDCEDSNRDILYVREGVCIALYYAVSCGLSTKYPCCLRYSKEIN